MMGKTHLLIGGAAWLATLAVTSQMTNTFPGVLELTAGWGIAAVGALAPDIDSRGSMITRSLGPITGILSWIIRKIGAIGDPSRGIMRGHRRLTHSLIGTGLIAIPFLLGISHWHLIPWIAAAFMVGWASHILADMITKMGCPLLWPLDKCYGLHALKTGTDSETYLIRWPATIANLALIVWIGWMMTR